MSYQNACPECGVEIARAAWKERGFLHARSRADGGPYYVTSCPECTAVAVLERPGDANATLTPLRRLARGSRVRAHAEAFLGAPRRPRSSTGPARAGAVAAGGAAPPRAAKGAAAAPTFPRALWPQLAVLGLQNGARPDAVKARFRQLVLQLHPDRLAGAGADAQRAAERELIRVTDAYRALLRAKAR